MTQSDSDARRREEEAKQPLRWWYLSFAADDHWLGACVVRARGILGAIARAHLLGINPGGQVLAFLVPEESEGRLPVDRLLSREEIPEAVSWGEVEDWMGEVAERALADPGVAVIEQDR